MANYSFSPALKQAFEQIYGPPYLARILFAEIGGSQEEDLFVRLDYDGSMHANSYVFAAIKKSPRPNGKVRQSCYLSLEQLGQLVVCYSLYACLSDDLDDWENLAMAVDSTGRSVGFSRRVESFERQEN